MARTPLLRAADVLVSFVDGLDEIDPAAWDALGDPDDPFTTWAFLAALERSGSATAETGWRPMHLVAERDGVLVAAAPLYLKSHSYGEYIFDWGWADGARRAGLKYYPKLLCAVPFTPATGRRLLGDPALSGLLVDAMRHLAEAAGLSSVHVLFHSAAEQGLWTAPWMARASYQLHWEAAGERSFEEHLAKFRHKERKEARRERRRPDEVGATVSVLRGAEIDAGAWAALDGFYRSTVDRKWGEAYLTPRFFAEAGARLGELPVAVMAAVNGDWVAGALCYQRGRHLYGRHWGCTPGYERLHFELCYHRPIALCIESGWTRFEAGAQGEHKLKRGLLPRPTYSAHWIAHPGLRRAVAAFLAEEAVGVEAQMEALTAHGPHRDEPNTESRECGSIA